MRIASTFRADLHDGVFIDGIRFPWAVGLDVSIEHEPDGLTVVWLPLYVDGVASMRTDAGETIVDADPIDGLGDVGEYARRIVRSGLARALPWLDREAHR